MLVGLAAGVVAACSLGSDPVAYDLARLESEIPEALIPDAPELVRSVDCPATVSAEVASAEGTTADGVTDGSEESSAAASQAVETGRAKTTVRCQAEIGKVSVPVEVSIAGTGQAVVSTEVLLVDLAELTEAVSARLSRDLGATSVSCEADPVFVSVPGARLACDSVDVAGRHRRIVISIVSSNGDWSLEFG